jgi:hypothetical protein
MAIAAITVRREKTLALDISMASLIAKSRCVIQAPHEKRDASNRSGDPHHRQVFQIVHNFVEIGYNLAYTPRKAGISTPWRGPGAASKLIQ